MIQDIEPADVYERVVQMQAAMWWAVGIIGVLSGVAFVANLFLFLQKRAMVRQSEEQLAQITAAAAENKAVVAQNEELVRQFKLYLERIELWLSLVEVHYQRGADQKEQTNQDIKTVKEILAQAAIDRKVPAVAVAEIRTAIDQVPKKVVTELTKEDSGLRKLTLPPADPPK